MTRTNSLKLRALGAASVLALALSGTAHAQDMLKIGVPTAMSGTYADLGNQAKRAVEFAIAEANARAASPATRSRPRSSTPRPSPTSPASSPNGWRWKATRC
ncbi:hypothetical protein [Azospirillum brasilense]|uniref:hypothetical protein n=1 Tax=Azospirillum brasilense TaxID=192 RepID=UPI0010C10937|nr:hypothetical protein [Azospirillum brasilense]